MAVTGLSGSLTLEICRHSEPSLLAIDADNIRIDPTSGNVLVGYGDGGLAIIDPKTRSKLGDIKLAGHPESFQLDPKTGRAFVNVPDARQVAVVDLKSGKQVAAWKTPGLAANFPMALDSAGGQLAIVFRRPAKLALLDPATGAVKESLDTCGDADDVFFDGKRDRILRELRRRRDRRCAARPGRVRASRTCANLQRGSDLALRAGTRSPLCCSARWMAWIRGSYPRLPPFAMMARGKASPLYFADRICLCLRFPGTNPEIS